MRRIVLAILWVATIFAVVPTDTLASDHADPIFNSDPDGGLTGLFVFPVGGDVEITSPEPADVEDSGPAAMPDEAATEAAAMAGSEVDAETVDAAGDKAGPSDLIFILGVHPSLGTPGPYDLDEFEYHIWIDTHSDVTFGDPADLARYGGTIVHPAGISADISMNFRLDDEAGLTETRIEGMDSSRIQVTSGVYDDPFIFPRFFGKNIVAIAVRVPIAQLPAGRQDFVIWGTSTRIKGGEQVDHVGRSNRTQLPRFDFLNTVPPSQQVEAIEKTAGKIQRLRDFVKRFPPPAGYQLIDLLWSIRYYDHVPDVMVFSFRHEPGFPNGRRLTDDVVAITCSVGECLLKETSFSESQAWPRLTSNDKPFEADFPYLASPWPNKPPVHQPGWFFPVLIIVIFLVFLAWIFCKIFCKICRRGYVPRVQP